MTKKARKSDMTEIQIAPLQAKQKYVAQKCPVCNGCGTVSFKRVPCHACFGKGYIMIPTEIEREKKYGADRINP